MTIIEIAKQVYGTQYTEQDLRFAALVAAHEREAIMDEWWMCVDSDLENGVKSLNERAAKKWHEEYPAISGFGEDIRARGEKCHKALAAIREALQGERDEQGNQRTATHHVMDCVSTTSDSDAVKELLAEQKELVVTAASENGVRAPEDSNPQQVEALQIAHREDCGNNKFDCAGCEAAYWRYQATVKGSLTVQDDIVERIADCLVEDHVALLAENKALREAAAIRTSSEK